ALMPGASFRGLHDSIVNYLSNDGPWLVLCNHEEVAVAVAHGYAKLTGPARAAAVHSTVGLMHATMTIFCAWCDRVPVLVLGGTGPMDATARRPWIDWIHTARAQGELVRDFTKWEDQPTSVAAMPGSLLRAWQLAHLEPRGPVYVCLDQGLQEERLAAPIAMPDLTNVVPATAPAPDPDAVDRAARLLVQAERPLLLLGRTSASDAAWADTVALAELLGAAVTTDRSGPTSFPTDHPLHQGMWRSQSHDAAVAEIGDADVILAVDRLDVAGALRSRAGRPVHLVNVSLESYATRSWSADYQEVVLAEIAITASADPTIAALRSAVERLLADAPNGRGGPKTARRSSAGARANAARPGPPRTTRGATAPRSTSRARSASCAPRSDGGRTTRSWRRRRSVPGRRPRGSSLARMLTLATTAAPGSARARGSRSG